VIRLSRTTSSRIRLGYKAWIAEGRVVRRGEWGVRGLFHIDQTDVIAAKGAPPKAKGKLMAAKSQLPLV
jgi:hypothetical protein